MTSRPQPSFLRRATAALAAGALALTGVVAFAAPAHAAAGEVSGTVARDFNANGVRDAGDVNAGVPADIGVEGVRATAYDALGAEVGSDLTDVNGEYTIDTSAVADGTPLRVEFSELPDGFFPSRAGADNGTSVQFVAAGAEDVDFLIEHPDDHSQSNAPLFTAIQWPALPSGTNANQAAIVGTPWNTVESTGSTFATRTTLATYSQVGAVWGLSYDQTGNDLYAAATYKRMSGLGELGLGGIYRINDILSASGATQSGRTTTPWVDVQGLPVVGGGTVDLGTVLTNAGRGLDASGSAAGTDIDAFEKAGRVGIGGIVVLPGEGRLVFTNLNDGALYAVEIAADGSAPTEATRIELPSTSTQQPWALALHRDRLYVGFVDTGAAPGASADDADLNAYVVSAPVAGVLAGAPDWTTVLTADLGYTKGNSVGNWGGASWGVSTHLQVSRWNTWADAWSWGGNTQSYNSGDGATATPGSAPDSVGVNDGGVHVYPQAVLTGIAFDTEGYMSLGFTDRTAIQAGNRNHAALPGVQTAYYETVTSGDLLIAAPDVDATGAATGSFTLESDGVAGSRTTAFTSAVNTQGPPSGTSREFYNDDQNKGVYNGNPSQTYVHRDIALGAVVAYPGLPEVASTAFDPLSGIRLSGVNWFSVVDGAAKRGYEHTTDTGNVQPATTFQKGGGLGGLSLAQLPPLVQIGDRVWYDADGNGRQDPDEPAIQGAVVTLYRADASGAPTGPALGSTTTDANGTYYFESTLWEADRFADPAADLVVVFEKPSDTAADVDFVWPGIADHPTLGTLTWDDLELTAQHYDADQPQNDSNADPATGRAPVTVTGPGANDHTIDAGFVAALPVTVAKAAGATGLPIDADAEFEITIRSVDFRGAPLPDQTVTLAVGDDDEITLPAFARVIEIVESATGYVYAVTPAIANDGNVVDGVDDDYTVTNTRKSYAIGDYVWIDEGDADGAGARNGIQDAGEQPLPGVTVYLLDAAGERVLDAADEPISATTNAQGFYLFDGLPAGQYRVEFVLSPTQAAQYLFTSTGSGTATDSDATPQADAAIGRTGLITLDDANTNLDTGYTGVAATEGIDPTWDAGVVLRTYAVGDVVWIDSDRDGVQDAGEPRLEGVTVLLFEADGTTPLRATTTNEHGRYVFDELPAGDYRIEFVLTGPLAEQYRFTTPDAGAATDATDSDAVEAADRAIGRTVVFTLDATTASVASDAYSTEFAAEIDAPITATVGIDPTWDAGVVTPDYAVGDRVWIDLDRDGIQDVDEPPLAGITVNLYPANAEPGDPPLATDVTDEDGRYLFDGLPAGEYRIEFVLPDGFTFTRADNETGDDADGGDSDADPATGWTAVIVLDGTNPALTRGYGDQPFTATEGVDPTWDAGVIGKTYAVGDRVWIDLDRDGSQGAGEPVLAGVTVELLDEDGTVVAVDVTDENGLYLFDNIIAGDYSVRFTLTPAQAVLYAFTAANTGSDLLDSDAVATADPAVAETAVFTVSDASMIAAEDYEHIAISPVTSTQGVDPTWDAGVIVKEVSVGDYVWLDADGDGVQGTSADEQPIPGVKLGLFGPDGEPVRDADDNPVTTTTDEDGYYVFDGLPALPQGQSYTVRIDPADPVNVTALEGLIPTRPGAGEDPAEDSSSWEASSITPLTTDGAHDPTLDFGFQRKTYAVGDYVWIDEDRDGAQDAGEPVLPGVTVELLDAEGTVLATDVTDANGRYLFDGLLAGEYQVRFTLSDADAVRYAFTQRDRSDDHADSDADPLTGETIRFILDDTNTRLDTEYGDQPFTATQGVDSSWDAGVIRKSVSVGDFVWVDRDRDGVQDPDEPGIPGVRLIVVGPDSEPVRGVDGAIVPPAVTDEDGRYTFENLPALPDGSSYTVRIDREDPDTVEALSPYVPTRPGAGEDPARDSSTWEATSRDDLTEDGDRDDTLDFGFVSKTYAIGDVVWLDSDRDGVQDFADGELPLSGVTVTLLDADGAPVPGVDPQVTGMDGRYLFDGLPAGQYRVQFTLSDEQAHIFAFTSTGSGDAGADSNADPATGRTGVIVLNDENAALDPGYADRPFTATQGVDPTWDAGVIRKSVSVGDFVWVDRDRDGVQDPGEPGIPGVRLVVVGPDGEPVRGIDGVIVPPAVTDEDGRYTFENLPALPPGSGYTVRIDREDPDTVEALSPYAPTRPGAGGDPARDSSTWEATSGDLTGDGDRDDTLDFGFVTKTYAIGDKVWLDSDKNGVQDAGEPPVAGVTVELRDGAGTVIATTTTDRNGRYVFDELPAGTYQVRFVLTAEQAALYRFTAALAGTDGASDSNAYPATGLTAPFVLDDSNGSLTTEYSLADILATQGIDPTWDAGLVLLEGALPDSGGNLAWGLPVTGAVLLLLGLALVVRRRENAV